MARRSMDRSVGRRGVGAEGEHAISLDLIVAVIAEIISEGLLGLL